jgi:hypothetical protein
LDFPFVARMSICGSAVELLGMLSEELDVGERGF